MACSIGKLAITVDSEGAQRSIASLTAALVADPGLAETLCQRGFRGLVFGEDLGGLFRCEAIDAAASGAGVLHGLRILPDERYLELVSAIVLDGKAHVAADCHGWPILSLVGCTSSVAKAGSAASGPGEAVSSISERPA